MPGRFASLGSVLVLLAATFVAAVLSVLNAPKPLPKPSLAPGNPRVAALVTRAVNSDLASGSFVVHVVSTLQRRGYSGTQRYTLVYQAPDRSELIGPSSANGATRIITIGDMRYGNLIFSSAGRGWEVCKVPPGEAIGASTATSNLDALRHHSGVSVVGGRYRIVVVGKAKLSRSGDEVAILTATVAGGRVTEEDIQAHAPTETTYLALSYSQFGSAPPIQTPLEVAPCPPFPGTKSVPTLRTPS